MRDVIYRVRIFKTKKVLGFEYLTNQYRKSFQWVREYAEGETWDGVFDQDDLIREQFTGLKDMTGVKIFENDIIKGTIFDMNCVIKIGEITDEYSKDITVFGVYYQNYLDDEIFMGMGNKLLNKAELKNIEVVGNIYENPELMSK